MDHICGICNSNRVLNRPGTVRDNQELDIFECGQCGLVFLSSFNHISDRFYQNSGMHGGVKTELHKWLAETEIDDERRFRFLEPILKHKNILDYGCGNGQFLVKARATASSVNGLEPETALQPYFQEKSLQVFTSLQQIQAQYDLITMFHVVEHLPDPIAVLQQLKSLLKPGGCLVIETPNSQDALLTLYKNPAFASFTYWSCHLQLFSADALGILASKTGFKVQYVKQVQRYSLANHLFWLSNGKPGGHQIWKFIDSQELSQAYEERLALMGKCDTLLALFSLEDD